MAMALKYFVATVMCFEKIYREGNIKSHHFYQWIQVHKNILQATVHATVRAVFSMSGSEEERE